MVPIDWFPWPVEQPQWVMLMMNLHFAAVGAAVAAVVAAAERGRSSENCWLGWTTRANQTVDEICRNLH